MAVLGALGAAGAAGGGSFFSVGSLLSTVGTVLGGIAESQSASFQAAIANQSAQIASDNAEKAIVKAEQDQKDQDIENAALIAEQTALQGGTGIVSEFGSFSLARKSAKKLARKDAKNIRDFGKQTSENFRQDEANQRNTATLAKRRSKSALVSTFFSATKSILGGSKSSGNSRISARRLAF